MTKYQPLPDKITIRDKYAPAMKITAQEEANEYFEICVQHTMNLSCCPVPIKRAEAEVIERANLAYYSQYYGNETRLRVEKLFNCEHPVFGKLKG